MLLITVYVVEMLAIMQCIYCIYGMKLRINVPLAVTVAAVLSVESLANRYGAALENSIIMYGILFLYCFLTFRKGLKDTLVSTVLFTIVIVVLQFISQYVMYCLIREETLQRTLCADILTLLFCSFCLPKFELQKIKRLVLKKDAIFCCSLLYILVLVGIILKQMRTFGGIRVELFIFSAPAVLLVFMVCRQRVLYQDFYEEKQKEVQLYREDKEKFEGLANNVRLKQHELNNHIMALNALHYTKSTYEELVEAQEKYAQQILLENKYNCLLRLYNSALPGFLYDKFKAMELRGVEITCRVSVNSYAAVIPEYYLIEMLGILLDNAAEAVESTQNRRVQVEITEYDREYAYFVRNRRDYTAFDEMNAWFQLDSSTKGRERGLGLYHLKCTCQKWNCTIGCRNVSIDEENWIEFRVGTGRKA